MNMRAEALAKRLEEGANMLAKVAEGMTMQQWATPIDQDGRTAGVLIHHVATMYPLEMELAQTIANGQAIAGVTWDVVADINAKHAHEHSTPDRMETLALLRNNSSSAATVTRTISDAQLDIAVPNSLYGDTPLTLQFWLEDHPVSHSYKHLANIKASMK
ncbi:MAG: hypothetical protein U0175_16905 [Caldilineaceae bacterium]